MDQVDKINLIQTILVNIYTYDDEGRRTCVPAEEVVNYAKILTAFIEGHEEEEEEDVEH